MPSGHLGQQIVFAIDTDGDQQFSKYVWVNVKVGESLVKVLHRKGETRNDVIALVKRLNGIQNARRILHHKPRHKNDRLRIRVPGNLRKGEQITVYADISGQAPTVTGGYAKLDVLDRPGRTGLSHFTGYDPSTMDIPITFEASIRGDGSQVEQDCAMLERMAGRGNFHGASVGAPATLRITTTKNGRVANLIPQNYQPTHNNDNAPTWRIMDIQWDQNPLRHGNGNRVRQHATVTVQAYTHVAVANRSVAVRNRGHHAHHHAHHHHSSKP